MNNLFTYLQAAAFITAVLLGSYKLILFLLGAS